MKLTEMIVSGLIKRGVFYEAKDFKTRITIPRVDDRGSTQNDVVYLTPIIIDVQAENMTIRIEKENKDG